VPFLSPVLLFFSAPHFLFLPAFSEPSSQYPPPQFFVFPIGLGIYASCIIGQRSVIRQTIPLPLRANASLPSSFPHDPPSPISPCPPLSCFDGCAPPFVPRKYPSSISAGFSLNLRPPVTSCPSSSRPYIEFDATVMQFLDQPTLLYAGMPTPPVRRPFSLHFYPFQDGQPGPLVGVFPPDPDSLFCPT